ncbi:hypothetical protein LA080_010585 [Diaporthe eres]|nr:hypothetical protein LA080_010585 [Diaporthe eres]
MRVTWGKDGRAPSSCAALHQTNSFNPKSLYQQSDHQQQPPLQQPRSAVRSASACIVYKSDRTDLKNASKYLVNLGLAHLSARRFQPGPRCYWSPLRLRLDGPGLLFLLIYQDSELFKLIIILQGHEGSQGVARRRSQPGRVSPSGRQPGGWTPEYRSLIINKFGTRMSSSSKEYKKGVSRIICSTIRLVQTHKLTKKSKMKFITAAATLFAGLAAAAPSTKAARTNTVTLTFWAAAENTFTLDVPIDGSYTYISSDLSFTSISASSPGNTVCHSYGVDNSDTVLYGSATDVPIGPPQEQTYATCEYL